MDYCFEDYRLDESSRELTRAGAPVPVERKVFDLLGILLRHADQVVARGRLLRELWPNVAVTGASLTRVVKDARRAIADDGRRQIRIRTVRGVGYRFVGPVVGRPEAVAEHRVAAAHVRRVRERLEGAVACGVQDLRGHLDDLVDACEDVLQVASRARERESIDATSSSPETGC